MYLIPNEGFNDSYVEIKVTERFILTLGDFNC